MKKGPSQRSFFTYVWIYYYLLNIGDSNKNIQELPLSEERNPPA